MEISRWSSELGERIPPDHRHHSHAPRRVRRESSGSFRHPIRGAFGLQMRSGGVRSCLARPPANFRVPPGQMRWTAGLGLPSLRAGTPAMTDTPPEFAKNAASLGGFNTLLKR